jgi:hypothetical protein
MSTTGSASAKQIEYAKNFLMNQYNTPNLNIAQKAPIQKIQAKSFNEYEKSEDDDDYITVQSIIKEKPNIKVVREFYKDVIEELNKNDD